jgi:hypothetical protein
MTCSIGPATTSRAPVPDRALPARQAFHAAAPFTSSSMRNTPRSESFIMRPTLLAYPPSQSCRDAGLVAHEPIVKSACTLLP